MRFEMRQINLLPEELQKAQKFNFIKRAGIVIFIPALSVLVGVHLLLWARINQQEDLTRQPLASYENKAVRSQKVKNDELKKQVRSYYDQNKDIIEKFVKKLSVAHMLKAVSRIAEGKVWLKSLVLDMTADSLRLEGKSFNTRLVSEFMLELKRLPYFNNVEPVAMDKGEVQDVKDIKEIDFQILCYLK